MARSITQEEVEKLTKKLNLKVVKQIAKGGQKEVYKVQSLDSQEILVLKIILPNTEIERVKREVRAVKIINHNNIPKIIRTNVDEIELSSQVMILTM